MHLLPAHWYPAQVFSSIVYMVRRSFDSWFVWVCRGNHLSFLLIGLLGVLMGVRTWDGLGVFSRGDFFFPGDFGMGAFMKVEILEGLGFHYFATGGGAIVCCLTFGVRVSRKKGSFKLSSVVIFRPFRNLVRTSMVRFLFVQYIWPGNRPWNS